MTGSAEIPPPKSVDIGRILQEKGALSDNEASAIMWRLRNSRDTASTNLRNGKCGNAERILNEDAAPVVVRIFSTARFFPLLDLD